MFRNVPLGSFSRFDFWVASRGNVPECSVGFVFANRTIWLRGVAPGCVELHSDASRRVPRRRLRVFASTLRHRRRDSRTPNAGCEVLQTPGFFERVRRALRNAPLGSFCAFAHFGCTRLQQVARGCTGCTRLHGAGRIARSRSDVARLSSSGIFRERHASTPPRAGAHFPRRHNVRSKFGSVNRPARICPSRAVRLDSPPTYL
jgi:hypothetical protein